MKKTMTLHIKMVLLALVVTGFNTSCERDLPGESNLADFPNTPDVFIDGFSGGLEYLPFEGSKLTAFTVDEDTRFAGSAAMRFDIPNLGDPGGDFAGAVFPDNGGRNLTEYDALTFYAKASQAATINEIGFGNDFGENLYQVTLENMRISTAWTKYVIPIPDPSKLINEKGLFWYAEGPENDNGYTFWIDELQFESLGTIAQPRPAVFNGEQRTEQTFIGATIAMEGLTQTFNLASGINQTVVAAPSYFLFTSSDESVAQVNSRGMVTVVGEGTATITAVLANVKAQGALIVESLGDFVAAPTPPQTPENVISLFSDFYDDEPVDFYNGFFVPDQTTLGGAELNINGDQIIRYTQLNFVATEFKNPTIDASAMTHFHADIQVREAIDPGDFITVELGDFGPNAVFDGGGDDSSGRYQVPSDSLSANQWISLDIALTDFPGLTSTSNLAQVFFISDGTISTLWVDNMYFYKK